MGSKLIVEPDELKADYEILSRTLGADDEDSNLWKWRYYVRDHESPQIFIDWTFFFSISAALERRVWWGAKEFAIFPNIYLVFIAPPGIGKSSVATVAQEHIFKPFDTIVEVDGKKKNRQLINRGPQKTTLEAMITNLGGNVKTVTIELNEEEAERLGKKHEKYAYSSVSFFAPGELGNLFSKDTQDLVRFFNEGWDCGDFNKETKGSGCDYISNMSVTLLSCATPGWLSSTISTALLNEGFAARAIFVHSNYKRHKKFSYDLNDDQRKKLEEVRAHIQELSQIYGQVDVPPDVQDWTKDWYENRDIPLVDSKQMEHYYSRKKVHLMKTAMIMHFSRTTDMTITIEDCEKALALLNFSEPLMAEALTGVGDNKQAMLAKSIRDYIATRDDNQASDAEIITKFFDEARQEDIKSALEFLSTVGYLKTYRDGKKMVYFNKRHEKWDQPIAKLSPRAVSSIISSKKSLSL